MKNRTKVIFSLIMVFGVLCCTLIPTLALSYVEPSDVVNLEKWQALEMVNLNGVDRSFTIAVDTHYGANGTYTLTNNNGDTLTTLVSGSSTKKINLEPTLGEEYTLTDVSLKFRDFSVVYDTADALNFLPINDIYICLDDNVGSANVGFNISFVLEGYTAHENGDYVLTPTGFSLDVNVGVSETSGTVVNNGYLSRIKINDIINRLIVTRSEWANYYTNSSGYVIGGVRNLVMTATNTNGGNNPLFVGLITTARNNGKNNNNEYMFARLPDVVIPGANAGYNEGYNAGYSTGYDDGYDIGYDEGYEKGFTDNAGSGFDEGYDLGYDEGLARGEEVGYNEGYRVGESAGYQTGVDAGFQVGKEVGIEEGYQNGYNAGEEVGYNKGYAEGNEAPSDVGEFLTKTIGTFLSTPIFGEGDNAVSLGMLLLIPITIPIVIMFLKLFAGG